MLKLSSESDESSVRNGESFEDSRYISKQLEWVQIVLYLPFSQHGFNLALVPKDKLCNYFLKYFRKIFIDTLVGDVSITVPKDFWWDLYFAYK